MADAQDNMQIIKIIDNQTILSSGTFTSIPINVNNRKLVGNITIQVQVNGTGTARFEWSQSNSFDIMTQLGDFVRPVSGYTIQTGFTATSGTDSNGKDLLNVPIYNCQFFKIICKETGGANSIVVNAWLSMQ